MELCLCRGEGNPLILVGGGEGATNEDTLDVEPIHTAYVWGKGFAYLLLGQ